VKPLWDSLGVVHAIHTERDGALWVDANALPERGHIAPRQAVGRDAIHVDADRERAHVRLVPGTRHGEVLVVHSRFKQAIDRFEKVVTVQLDVEAKQVAAEHPVENFPATGRCGTLRDAARDVPEMADDGVRALVLHQPRQQREMVVLHQHDGRRATDFFEHGIGKARVHA
jgi:hypothetical protein